MGDVSNRVFQKNLRILFRIILSLQHRRKPVNRGKHAVDRALASLRQVLRIQAVNITVDNRQGASVQRFPMGKKQKSHTREENRKRNNDSQRRTDGTFLEIVEMGQKLRLQSRADADLLEECMALLGTDHISAACGSESPGNYMFRNALFDQRGGDRLIMGQKHGFGRPRHIETEQQGSCHKNDRE